METKDIILQLRTKKGFSQEELAEKVFVTRQQVRAYLSDMLPKLSYWKEQKILLGQKPLKPLSRI